MWGKWQVSRHPSSWTVWASFICLMIVVLSMASPALSMSPKPNILLITLDDMGYDTPGFTGSTVPNVTPHLDALAAQGMRFEHAHMNVSVCQPSRSTLMTGRYPHRHGAIGFRNDGLINTDVPTLAQQLDAAGYYLGILGKDEHLMPVCQFGWDELVGDAVLGAGRDPEMYYQYTESFIQNAKDQNKPFFLMANSNDPHHPFMDTLSCQTYCPDFYDPGGVEIFGFLPDLPQIVEELAQYYCSSHRSDETVGKVLQALAESGEENNTLVMCFSDNGPAFPFAKTNVWLASTKTFWLVRWPGMVQPGTEDTEHMISGIDYMPTILEAVGLPQVEDMDGTSFLPLLTQPGSTQPERDRVYTVFHITADNDEYPMRSILSKKYGYIYNDWSNGQYEFRNKLQERGITWPAMVEAAETDSDIADRVDLFLYRVKEELYDYELDPDALHNLIDDPLHVQTLWQYRCEMMAEMLSTEDPLAPEYAAYLHTLQTSAPIITQHPSNQQAVEGEEWTTNFTVVSAGSQPFSYQWQKNQVNLSNGGHYSGATTATLIVTSTDVSDVASYRCVVTNTSGSIASHEATLTLIPPAPPTITQQPSGQVSLPGASVVYTVTTSGTDPLTYQWQKNQVNLSNGGHYSGTTTATLTVSLVDSNDGANYRCVVTNNYGNATSDDASLTITTCTAPVLLNGDFEGGDTDGIADHWTSYTQAEAPSTINYTIQSDSPKEGLQCQMIDTSFTKRGGAGVYQTITGCASGATYTISGWMKTNCTTSKATIKCAPNGSTSYSNAIDLIPAASTSSLQWVPFSGQVTATASTITLFLNQRTSFAYSTRAACFDGLTITANGDVCAVPIITQQPSNQIVQEDSTTTFTIAADSPPPFSYQWQKNQSDLSNDGHYSGCTTATLTIASVDNSDEANYRCIVTNAYGTATSNEASLTLAPPGPPTITQHPANQTVITGGAVDFMVDAVGTSPLSYQWQKNESDLSNGGHDAGCTTAILTVSAADSADEANYRCIVTNPYGTVNSNAASLTVASCTPAVLLNGGFEITGTDGIAANWTGYTRAQAPSTVSYNQQIDMEVEGFLCQQIGTSYVASGGAGVYQVMTGCLNGATYTISGWMKTTSTNCRATVKCAPDGSTSYDSTVNLFPAATTTSVSWVPFSGRVLVTAPTMTLFLDSQTYVSDSGAQAARFDGLTIECGTPLPPPAEYGDYDADGDVDSADIDTFIGCFSGPTIAYAGDCEKADFDQDNDVDQNDFGIFQRCYSGQDNPADPTCAGEYGGS